MAVADGVCLPGKSAGIREGGVGGSHLTQIAGPELHRRVAAGPRQLEFILVVPIASGVEVPFPIDRHHRPRCPEDPRGLQSGVVPPLLLRIPDRLQLPPVGGRAPRCPKLVNMMSVEERLRDLLGVVWRRSDGDDLYRNLGGDRIDGPWLVGVLVSGGGYAI